MAGTKVAAFEVEKLAGEAFFDGRTVAARLVGSASHRDIEALDHFLAKVLAEARRVLVTSIVLDLRDVGYMNSSHFKSLVSWLGSVAKAQPRVEVKVRANQQHHWQKRSLTALCNLTDGLVTIDS